MSLASRMYRPMLLAFAIVAGCSFQTEFQDDLRNRTVTAEHDLARLHGPYVVGSVTRILALSAAGSLEGWTLESSDPAVLRFGAVLNGGTGVEVTATAIAPGTSTVRLRDTLGNERVLDGVEGGQITPASTTRQ